MEVLWKCLGALLLATVCSLLIRDKNGGAALGISVAACGAVIMLCAEPLGQLTDWCREMADLFGGQELLTPLLRCLGIGLTVRLTAETLRDAGERALAVKAEVVGAVCGMVTILPLIQRMMGMISGL